jgi:alpha-beta hydrolase superfamily lysophospholipase
MLEKRVLLLDEKKIKMKDGTQLFCKVREAGKKAWLIVSHGLGEHLGRHEYILDLFKSDFNLFFYDLRGHGRSEGSRGDIKEFSNYTDDLREVLYFLKSEYNMGQYILFGHSMGALITASYVQNYANKYEKKDLEQGLQYPMAVFLSAPPVSVLGSVGKVVELLPFWLTGGLAGLPYSLRLGGTVDTGGLSHSPKVKEEFEKDKLNLKKLHTRLLLSLVHATKETFARPIRPKCPTFVAAGSGDKVICFPALKSYFSTVEKSILLKVVEGGRHELHNEIEKYKKPYLKFLEKSLEEVLYEKS